MTRDIISREHSLIRFRTGENPRQAGPSRVLRMDGNGSSIWMIETVA